MPLYFTADTHFGAKRTLDLSRRPFKSVDEMDQTLINNWNGVVKPGDNVLHLGDFGNLDIRSKLNGKITLLLGNYERDLFPDDPTKQSEFVSKLKNDYGFDSVIITPTAKTDITPIEIDDTKYRILISHEPQINGPDIITSGVVNLFGHIHRLCMIKRYGLNVGVDCHDFKPIDMEVVKFYTNAIIKFYDNNVFQ